MTRKLLRAALFLLPVSILLPHLTAFPFLPISGFSDLLISHYPNAIYLLRSLREWHSLPFWSPTVLSGYPFAANPLSGLFYLPGWLVLVFPQPLGFNLVIILHLLLGGWGLYRLLREEGLVEWAALLGALLFASMPKLYSHLGAGHITLIYAVCWTPWLLLFVRRSFQAGVRENKWVCWGLAGAVLGLILLADVRWAAYAGLLWLAYGLYTAWRSRAAVNLPRLGLYALFCLVLALLIAAPLLLPLIQYTQLATRSQMGASDNLTLSMPPGQLLGLVYPGIGSGAEWMLYPGGVAFVLFLYSLAQSEARKKAGFWLSLTVIALLLALGANFPPAGWLARLPGFSLLRVPPRALFLSGLGFAVTAAYGWQTLLDAARIPAVVTEVKEAKPKRSYTGLVLFAVTAFVVLFAAAAVAVVPQPLTKIQFSWGGLLMLFSAALVLLARSGRIPAARLSALLLALGLIDVLGVNSLGLVFRPAEEVNGERQSLAGYLNQQADSQPYRVYSPSYSLPQQSAALNGLELADGVDPMQLAAYVSYMQPATGVPFEGYSVTLPPFAGGDPAVDNQSYSPDPTRLGLLNVRYVVADFPLPDHEQPASGFTFLSRFGSAYVYENPKALPRAWVQPVDGGLGEQILSKPAVSGRPDDLLIRAQGPGRLVLSEIVYPGWQVTVDGQSAVLETAGGLLRSVQLPEGEHPVHFFFRPTPVYLGLGLAAAAWLLLIGLLVIKKRPFELNRGRRHG